MSVSDDTELLAAELALGLLDEPERSAAEARARSDPEFAALVETWRDRLEPMLASSTEAPPDELWERIHSQLAANDDAPPSSAEAALRRWRAFGIGASAVAASLALLLVTRGPVESVQPVQPPPAAPSTPAPVLVAALQGEDGSAIVTITVEQGSRMIVTPVRLDPSGRVPELWIIPEDGTPRSLGVIRTTGASQVTVAPAHRPHVHVGATFAISEEPPGGSPSGAPTGPVVASGKIDTV